MHLMIFIAVGGGLGAVLRYLCSQAIIRLAGTGFPLATMVINVAGSLLMGLAVGLLATRFAVSPEWKAFWTVGLLGGFTTFSTFSLEGAALIEKGSFGLAFIYMAGSVVLGLAGYFVGLIAVKGLT